MPEYTLAAVVSVVVVVVLELAWLRTGMFRRPAFWITAVIVFGFQIPVDGWLTKLSAPIVLYAESHAKRPPDAVGHPGGGLRVRLQPHDAHVADVGSAGLPGAQPRPGLPGARPSIDRTATASFRRPGTRARAVNTS